MQFKDYLLEQIHAHPSVQPQDIVKQCYQAAYSAEHMLSDLDKARVWLETEMSGVTDSSATLFEMISADFARINLAPWKQRDLPGEWLLNMFAASAVPCSAGDEVMEEYLKTAGELKAGFPFPEEQWAEYLSTYRAQGMPSVHHSSEYSSQEHPAYRLVSSRFVRILPILKEAAKCQFQDRPCIIAIDGRAASGKSTMAEALSLVLNADIVHMDDFFLPKELRTPNRLSSPGGNVHYERFLQEVLPHIGAAEDFSYQVFSCRSMRYSGSRSISSQKFRIVEGSYSCHPKFGAYADITVFSDVDSDTQLERIRKRNGENMAKVFAEKWIPMEEKYFTEYDIKRSCKISELLNL